jgi:hypothetical protein
MTDEPERGRPPDGFLAQLVTAMSGAARAGNAQTARLALLLAIGALAVALVVFAASR